MILHCRALIHGRSDRAASIDTMGAREYMEGLGAGGAELFETVLEPGLKGPVGGSLERVSRAILMATVWNMLVSGHWNLGDGVDRIPEAIAAQVDVRKGGKWRYVWRKAKGEEMAMEGAYVEVTPISRLVTSETWGPEWPETINTVDLTEQGRQTMMTMTIKYPSQQARDAALQTGMKQGMEQSYARLDRVLAASA